jgi:tetratricopeptide (TPR) repeat protein
MTIFYHVGDLEFKAKNLQELKAELEEYFSYKGFRPSVEIISDYVRVDIDSKKLERAEAQVRLAFDCCNIGNFTSAKEFLNKALVVCPLHGEAHRTMAQIYMHEGKQDDAITECREALKCEPDNMWAMILMGNLLWEFKKDREGALRYYNKVVELYPDNLIALNNVAGVKLSMRQYEDALKLFEKVLEKNDSYANAYYGKVACLKDLGMLEEAFETARVGCIKAKDTPENPGTKGQLTKMYLAIANQIVSADDRMEIVREIKNDIEKEFGVPIEFYKESGMNLLGKLEYYKHHHTPENIIRFNPDKPFPAHYIIHELMHLYMYSAASKEGVNKVVFSNDESYKRFRSRFIGLFKPLFQRLGAERFNKFYDTLFSGLCSRTMNSPLDLFVEQRIFEKYPKVRPLQMLSLYAQELDNIEADKKSSELKELPKIIVDATKTMNLVQCLQFKELYGIDLVDKHGSSKANMNLAYSLFKEFQAYQQTYTLGDEYDLLDYFINNLRLQDILLIEEEKDILSTNNDNLNLEGLLRKTPAEKTMEDKFQAAHKDGEDPTITTMMSFYMLAALEELMPQSKDKVKAIAFDIATAGISGIDPHKKSGYFVPTLPGRDFGGYQFLAYYYVSWAIAIPEMLPKLNLPFDTAYNVALSLYAAKKKNN